jgi:SecD/SecF fusion protein
MQAQEDPTQTAPAPAATEAPAATAAEAPAAEPATPATEAEAPAASVSPAPGAATEATPEGPAADQLAEALREAVETVPASPPTAAPVEAAADAAIPSSWVFLLGLGLLALFVMYFAAESSRRKRVLGSVLAVAVGAICVWLYGTLGMQKGIELQGGVSMEIKIQPAEGREVTADTQRQAIDVLMGRLNAMATGEVFMAPSGTDGIFLQMPGVGQEQLRIMQAQLEQVALLEFSILHPQSQFLAPQVANGAQVVPGYRALPYKAENDKEGNPLPTRYGLVRIKPDMSGEKVSRARHWYGPEGDSISVDFTSEGAKVMGPLTMEHRGEPLAIILDGVILSSPNIREPFSTSCLITGNFTQAEAKALASALENPLQNPIAIEFSNYISPTMGEASVQQGILAGVSGLVLTLLFILLYYRLAGFVALVGLSICLAMIFGTMALFQFTLTLPGIAGIILTIGMAVDANVLIYERLREEMAAGKSLKAAIEAAYDKAFSSIMDANLTSLMTAIILYAIADVTVKGFAITLIIGIAATLFTALIVTRVCYSWIMDAAFFKKLTFMNFVPEKSFDFLGQGKFWLRFSVVAAAVSIVAIPLIDPRGVELKGGDKLTIHSGDSGLSKESILDSLKKLDLGATPLVQEQRAVGDEGEFFLVRTPAKTAAKVQDQLEADLGIRFEDTTVSSVGPAVGRSMLISSGLALLIGMIAIMAYVTIRYEFAFALGAIAALVHDVVVALGVTTLLGQELTLISVGALLTVAGYSINDTIIIFDRVREGLATRRGEVKDVMNYSLNKTLGRTILTSGTTLFTVLVLAIFGGPGLRNFAMILIVGLVVGTFSSLFVASPIVLWWAKRSGTNLRREVLDTEQSKIEGAAPQQA